MNVVADSEWQQSDRFEPMASMAEQDFANFLDLDIDLDFPTFDANAATAPQLPDLPPDLHLHNLTDEEVPSQAYNISHGAHQQPPLSTDISGLGNELFDFTLNTPYEQPQHQHHTPQDHAFLPRSIVPPTPNSVEMHGDIERYLQQLDTQTRALLEQQYRSRSGDAVGNLGWKSRSRS